MATPVLGIDLGTTNSVVAHADERGIHVIPSADGDRLIPSVVSFHPSGEVLVGRAARERRLLDAKNTIYSVKRLIGRPFESEEVKRARSRFPFDFNPSPTGGVLVVARDESYTLSEISAFVLREVRAIAEASLGQPCTRAVITVPANFNELQRSATKAAGRVAGLDVLRILNEPTAAALAYGYGRGSRERVAIFDLGGGTFDVTILELAGEVFEVLATAGDTYLGGDDIDSLIATQMAEAFLAHHRYDTRGDRQAHERLRAAAEWAKCQLSHEGEVQLRVEELAYGEGGISLDLTFGLTRSALEALAMPLLARAFDVCEEAMRVAGVRPTQLDNVILVGGSTRMPLVRRMVHDYFGREPLTDMDPDLVVAQGAAIQAQVVSSPRPRTALGRVALRRVERTGGGISEENAAVAASDPRSEPTGTPRTATLPPPGPDSSGLPPQAAAINLLAGGTLRPGPWQSSPPPRGQPREARRGHGDAEPGPRTKPLPALPEAPPGPPPAPPGFPDAGATPPPPGLPPRDEAAAPAVPEILAGDLVEELTEDGERVDSLGPPPLLLDVTPLSLGVETVAGYCEHIIKRNSAIPTEQTRLFSTGQDNQESVVVRICQGESRRLEENQLLGEVTLSGLLPGRRGAIPIEVTFILDADGRLSVRAIDKQTGREQSIGIQLIGGLDEADIATMRSRLEHRFGPPS